MTTRGRSVWLGLAALAAVWGIARPAWAITVMCSNPLGECEVSNDNFDSVTCDCGMSGEITGGGDEWETLSEAELLEICEEELEMCGEFGGTTSGGSTGDTDATTTLGTSESTATVTSTGDTEGDDTGASTTGAETTGDDTTGDDTTGDDTTGAETTGAETTGAETTGGETTGGESTGGAESTEAGSSSSATNVESSGTNDDDSTGDGGATPDGGGCGCATTGPDRFGGLGLGLCVLALLGRRARRRR